MKSQNNIYDVIVIGGGPAGSTAASFLAMKGHRVLVLEKDKFPRDHVGESLLPFCYHILKDLGVLDELLPRFVRKPGVRFLNHDGTITTTWCFSRVIKDESFLSFQVTRSDFDDILLKNSRRHGAVVKELTKVSDVDLHRQDGGVAVTAQGPRGGKQVYYAKFCVDASGRSSFIATHSGWRQPFEGLDRTAIWTHWTGIKMSGGLDEGLSLICYLGGDKKGWIWLFPLSDNRLTVGVVLNNSYIREEKARLEPEFGKNWMSELYRCELLSSPFVQNILNGGEIAGDLRVEGNYSYFVDKEKKFGPCYALIGDASSFIDPIFSSGIFLSMKGSRLLSEALHKMLTSPQDGKLTELEDVYKQINGAYGIVYKLIRSFYNPQAISFAEAAAASKREHILHQTAMASGHYLLSGGFFEDHERFEKFIDLMQTQRTYRKFKYLVIDRSEFQDGSCENTGEEIFPSLNGKKQKVEVEA